MAPLLEVKDLQVEFTTRDGIVKAVNGITFSLEAGRVLTILGESGSGKSVTLRSLVRLLPKVRTQISGEVVHLPAAQTELRLASHFRTSTFL